jgi:hypothetical protein
MLADGCGAISACARKAGFVRRRSPPAKVRILTAGKSLHHLNTFTLLSRLPPYTNQHPTGRGDESMSETVMGRAGEQIAETAKAAGRLTSAMAEAVEDSIGAAKRVAKQAGDAAEELFDDTTKRLQRHPVETVVGSMVVGLALGIVVGWLIARK